LRVDVLHVHLLTSSGSARSERKKILIAMEHEETEAPAEVVMSDGNEKSEFAKCYFLHFKTKSQSCQAPCFIRQGTQIDVLALEPNQ